MGRVFISLFKLKTKFKKTCKIYEAFKVEKKYTSLQKRLFVKWKKIHVLYKCCHLIWQTTQNKDDYYNILQNQSAITNLNPQFTFISIKNSDEWAINK